jgi:DNA-binding NtrC family response regulator
VIPITVPPLRERKEDLPLLVEHFLTQIEHANPRPTLPGQIGEQLSAHTWPGNVRELRNAIRQYVTFGSLEFADLRHIEPDEPPGMSENGTDQVSSDLREAVAAFEKQHILHALNQHRWHRARTAAALRIPIKTLYRKMKHHHLI